MDVTALEDDLAAELRDLGGRWRRGPLPGRCPYGEGDMVIGKVSTSSRGPLQIVLDMRNDPYCQ
jgi:hypothetical protein